MTRKGRKVRDSALATINPLLQEFAEVFDIAEVKKQLVAIQKVRRYLDEYRYR